jgi:hypothetical protein
MPLRLEGELSFTVDGPQGSTSGTARADGTVLHVRAEDPVAAWDVVAGAAPAAAGGLGVLADHLAAEGLSVEVTGPAGRLATVGAGADSALGHAVTGSRHVAPGTPTALRPLVVSQLRQGTRRRSPLLLALTAVVVLAVRRRRRRS